MYAQLCTCMPAVLLLLLMCETKDRTATNNRQMRNHWNGIPPQDPDEPDVNVKNLSASHSKRAESWDSLNTSCVWNSHIYIYLYIYVYPRHFLKYDAVVFPEHDVTWWVTQRFASHHGGVVARWRPGRHAFGPHPMRRLRPGWYVVEHSWDFTKSPRGRQKSRAVDVEQLNVLNVLNWLYWIVLILIVEFAVERGKTW